MDQDYYWTDKWQEGEDEADRNIVDNDYIVFNTPQEAIDYLHFLSDSSISPHKGG